MKFGYFGFPHTGGTWTVFQHLRDGLERHGITVNWLATGKKAEEAACQPRWQDELLYGCVIAGETDDGKTRAKALADYLANHHYDGIFINVLAGPVEMNIARYLDPKILRIMIVHNITPGTYAAASAIRDYVHATATVSPRIRNDLISRCGFPSDATFTIPTGIDISVNQDFNHKSQSDTQRPLRILYLGRIKDEDKGVFWLSPIMKRLAKQPVELTIAGDGPDLPELRSRLAPFGDRVQFLGRVQPVEVPELCAKHDVFVFPSRFEGQGLSLVEAMAAGCVPVCSRITGVTDFIVEDGKSGYIFPVGDHALAAKHISELADDRDTLSTMSKMAREAIIDRFSIEQMADRYAEVLQNAVSDPPLISPVRAFENWSFPNGLKKGLRSYLPKPIKNFLRSLRA